MSIIFVNHTMFCYTFFMKKNIRIPPLPLAPGFLERRIYLIRGQKVMLDRDLAELYDVRAIALRQQVKRNPKRFPADFIFQLNKKEITSLVSQNVIPSFQSLGGSLPFAFTEQGVSMLSSVLTSNRAIEVNVAIMRAFVKLRVIMSTHKDVIIEIKKIKREQRFQHHDIKRIFKIIEALLTPQKHKTLAPVPKKSIGFRLT